MYRNIIKSFICYTCVMGMTHSTAIANTLEDNVIRNYIDIAEAVYTDSLITARSLSDTIRALLDSPSHARLEDARNKWIIARQSYQQTEVYRFGNAVVDDWEGKVNSWPLDEGMIDYVDTTYSSIGSESNLYTANIIANTSVIIDGRRVDASEITAEFISNILHEAEGVEANVATGYHAIEFMLWGQDLNGTEAGAGNRPYTDFSIDNCSNGFCERRRQYLRSVTSLLVNDLEEMVLSWGANGAARNFVEGRGTKAGLITILTGMGSLSQGELAGERMKLGLLLGDPEEEHDCFSDNTHNAHYYNAIGIRNVYTGQYKRPDGSTIKGASISDLVMQVDHDLNDRMMTRLNASVNAVSSIVQRAEQKEAYDQMIATGNTEGNKIVQDAIDALITQAISIEMILATLDLGDVSLQGSNSLDGGEFF